MIEMGARASLYNSTRKFQQENGWEAVWKPNKASRELIGLIDPSWVMAGGADVTASQMTCIHPATSAEWAEYPDKVRLLFVADTAASYYTLTGFAIRGRPVVRFGGEEGPVNDKYVDYESMGKEGEKLLEIGNNYVCSQARVNQIADWYWKYNRVKKHVYTVTVPGFCAFYEIGEWYTLVVTSALEGAVEAINATVECISVECRQDAGDIGQTTVDFREVQTNWVYDSVEYARFIAIGRHGRREMGRIVTVGASDFGGFSDFYCDGVNDQEEINTAIAYLNVVGGGQLLFTRGGFNLTSGVLLCGNLEMGGEVNTTFLSTGTFDVMTIAGSASVLAENVNVHDISIEMADGADDLTNAFYSSYCAGIITQRLKVNKLQGCGIVYSNSSGVIAECQLEGVASSNLNVIGIQVHSMADGKSVSIVNNKITGLHSASDNAIGIIVLGDSNLILGNQIKNVTTDGTSAYAAVGIYVTGQYGYPTNLNNITDNDIASCTSSQDESNGVGLWVADTASGGTAVDNMVLNNACHNNNRGILIGTATLRTKVAGNVCFNNGSDTGIDNANGHNFLDQGTDTVIG